MNLNSFKYFVNEGVKSFLKNGLMSIASVITIMLCLIMFGIYVLFAANLNYVARQVEENYEIQVFIKDGTSSSRTAQLADILIAIPNVNKVVFVSKKEALDSWKAQFGENSEILEGLELDNPLRDSYKITVDSLSLVDETVSKINEIEEIANIKNNKDTIEKLISVTSVVKTVSFWIMVVFALVSIFIISNAIRITIFARRREVNIMKFIGATDWFISLPFMIEGIIIGIIGALFSVAVLSQVYIRFLNLVGDVFTGSISLYTFGAVAGILTASLAGMGTVIGALGSLISLRRHLHV
ncbi:MAG: Cell division protein FtsX [Firmicutes bacterium ADurb.Bin193]|nr:MAG: Cell division protein FtsX [Firmicutes bacterium ADurb.Bin193]